MASLSGFTPAGMALDTISGVVSGIGRQQGLNRARAGIDRAITETGEMSDDMRTEQSDIYQPYTGAGSRAIQDLESFRFTQPDSYQAGEFQGVDLESDPGVQFRARQAMNASEASAGKKGQLFSGPQQKALMREQSELASQEYQNAYDRDYGAFRDTEDASRSQYNTEADRLMALENSRMGQLEGLTSTGLNASSNLGGAYQGIGTNELNTNTDLLGARADVDGALAAAPYNTAAGALGSAGGAAADLGKFYMNRKLGTK